jgi:hypothetical protein
MADEPRQLAIEQGERARGHNEAGRWGRHDMPDMEIPEVPPSCFLNTHALVSQFIKPLTEDVRGPLFALVPPESRGRPTAFLSHTWSSLLIGPQRQRIGTLNALLKDKDEFVWIDFACYNQHVFDDISGDMLGVIESIQKLVVAVTPTPLYSRSWCLWELYCADTIGLAPELRVCEGFRNDKIQSVNALYRSFSGVENARSSNAQSEAAILKHFIDRHGSAEKADAAVEAMLRRQLGGRWHELQPREGPLKFSADPWIADPQGSTLRAYDAYWEPGLMDSVVCGEKETVRELFARSGVYVGAAESAGLSLQKDNPANLRFIQALQNEDVDSILNLTTRAAVDVDQPLPFKGALAYEVAPPLHFLVPWASFGTIELLVLMGADVNLPWTFPPETNSRLAMERERLVRVLLNKEGELPTASWTPLMLAAQRGDASVCSRLIKAGALVAFACPQTGLVALHVAAAMMKPDLVRLLAQSGAFVDAKLPSGITALHIAAATGDVGSIALLLQFGAHKEVRNRAGQSALDLARRANHAAAADLLV